MKIKEQIKTIMINKLEQNYQYTEEHICIGKLKSNNKFLWKNHLFHEITTKNKGTLHNKKKKK